MIVKVNKYSVSMRMSKEDYRLLRLILEDGKHTSTDANIRCGIADLLLPNMPAIIS